MIITKKFCDWYLEQDKDMQGSVINFVISTMCRMKFKERIYLAFEILMGTKFNKWISRNQVIEDK